MSSYEDFKKLELITAKVKSVEEHPNADRLYVIVVDTGTEEKTIVAGIKDSYSKEELLGKVVVLFNNLEPAIIRGVESNGMLLATRDESGLAVLTTDKDVKVGSPVS